MFCPECGKPLRDTAESAAEPPTVAAIQSEAREVPAPETSTGSPEVKVIKPSKHRASDIVRHGGEKTRETLHKASSVARGAIEDNVKRVEKIHHVSSVMLEEAHWDASLRFVLVALGLFIVFVILLILSKVMG